MKLTVNVTQDHIEAGLAEDCTRCPVALAISDALAGMSVIVSYTAFRSVTGQHFRVPLPKIAADFIEAFDALAPEDDLPQPFTFDVEVPDWAAPSEMPEPAQ